MMPQWVLSVALLRSWLITSDCEGNCKAQEVGSTQGHEEKVYTSQEMSDYISQVYKEDLLHRNALRVALH
jgi:hypothetical protein